MSVISNSSKNEKNPDNIRVLKVVEIFKDGQGIAYDDQNRQIFIKDGLLGEEVEVEIYGQTDRYAQGRILNVLSKSKERITSNCKFVCGACSYKCWSYDAEIIHKTQETLKLYKDVPEFTLDKFTGFYKADNDLYYRNKAIYAIGFIDNDIKVGLYEKKSHSILEIDDCDLEQPWMNKTLKLVRNKLKDLAKDTHYNDFLSSLRYLYLRGNDEKMAVIVSRKYSDEVILLSNLIVDSGITNVLLNINNTDGNRVLGDRFEVLNGNLEFCTQLLGKKFSLSPSSFLQINLKQAEVLYKLAIDFLQPSKDESLADLYCGIGTISLCVHDRVKHVYGIECVEDAVINANKNKVLNDIQNVSFYTGLVEQELPKLIKIKHTIDIAILDPARKGVEERVFKTLSDCKTQRVAYISCNPKSQVRDLKLAYKYGFMLKKLAFVDMFPRTSHVETVVLLSREK